MAFLVGDLNWAELRVFLLRRPAQAAPGESDDANDNKDDADDGGRFHLCELTMSGGLGSIDNQHHNRNDEQDMNESTHRVGADQSK